MGIGTEVVVKILRRPQATRTIFATFPSTDQTITQFGLSLEYRNDLEFVTKIDKDLKHYRALDFHTERLVGGVLIGKGNRAG